MVIANLLVREEGQEKKNLSSTEMKIDDIWDKTSPYFEKETKKISARKFLCNMLTGGGDQLRYVFISNWITPNHYCVEFL